MALKGQHKYHAKPSRNLSGEYFGSKIEREFFDHLVLCRKAGLLQSFKHQPPAVEFPCGNRWRVDFLVTLNNGDDIYIEVKGLMTDLARFQIKCWQQHQPFPLIIATKGNNCWIRKKAIGLEKYIGKEDLLRFI